MNIFKYNKEEQLKKSAPLAMRMRPRSLSEYIGQEHFIGEGKLLRRAIQADRLSSMIFFGPPGTGKTALAQVIAATTSAAFLKLNAVSAGVGDIRRIIEEASERLGMWQRKTILFIDEIHRFNKAQQDALLPSVEEGLVILIGATTENPYFEVNGALLSRSMLFRLEPLKPRDIRKILSNALTDEERGLGSIKVSINEEALAHIIYIAEGDARRALNALELAALTASPDGEGVRRITLEVAEESIQQKAISYDKNGDQHYDVISAFIKSLRGSDPDGALYWLAKMLAAGEDPRFIARRMIILASEDIGLADPQALIIAVGAFQAFEYVGMPEGRLSLAEAAVYLACAPKSNAVIKGIDQAFLDVKQKSAGPIPVHLRDAHYKGATNLNHGKGYKYPHDYPGNFVLQQYLPDSLHGTVYYRPTINGFEKLITARQELRKKAGDNPDLS
ncbi:MAG: AAA family ATPase [Bacillota bacterium]